MNKGEAWMLARRLAAERGGTWRQWLARMGKAGGRKAAAARSKRREARSRELAKQEAMKLV